MKIISVVGARPNFMKLAPLERALRNNRNIEHIIVHTGQHYDYQMSKSFFDRLEIPEPKINLEVGSGGHGTQTGKIMISLEEVVLRERPDLVIVYGDVNSTIAAALVASKLNIPIAHVEAGLRSFDKTMPEEINRKLTDAISDYLFVVEETSIDNLMREGVSQEKIFLVGDTMIDCLIQHLETIERNKIYENFNLVAKDYLIATIHRQSNSDSKEILTSILDAFEEIQKKTRIIMPLHPRTKKNIEKFGLEEKLAKMANVIVTEPMNYIDFVSLMYHSKGIVSDSGGVRQEAAFLKIPCVTIRENTERPDLIKHGINVLCNPVKEDIVSTVNDHTAHYKPRKLPWYWDGNASGRILAILFKEKTKSTDT